MIGIISFIKHLRLNYQFLILSGPYLAGGLFSPHKGLESFVLGFIALHLFLFGGATVYNSYWDKDEGPIGGLYNPPVMHSWMLLAAWIFQAVGFIAVLLLNWEVSLVYLFAVILFWLYSSPIVRLKIRPKWALISMSFAGSSPFLIGYYLSGGSELTSSALLGAFGSMCIIAGLYPFSQAYQFHDDAKKGDRTFCVVYGYKGVKSVFLLLYPLGLLMMSAAFYFLFMPAGLIYLLFGTASGILIWRTIMRLKMDREDYHQVMRVKYGASIANIMFIFGVFLFV